MHTRISELDRIAGFVFMLAAAAAGLAAAWFTIQGRWVPAAFEALTALVAALHGALRRQASR